MMNEAEVGFEGPIFDDFKFRLPKLRVNVVGRPTKN
jgi:hypothetical protein